MKTGTPDDLENFVLPIFVMRRIEAAAQPQKFAGTGFLIAPELHVTCWHCVSGPLGEKEEYAVATMKTELGYQKSLPLLRLEQDGNGSDLATALIDQQSTPFRLAKANLTAMDHVRTYGYPLTDTRREEDDSLRFVLHGRYLEGFVTQVFNYEHHQYGTVPSYELDMPAPRGLSGGPLFSAATGEVVGVVYGTNDVGLVEEYSSVNLDTGERKPEVHRIISFALAHYTETLRNVTGQATHGLKLWEYVKAFNPNKP